MTGYRNTTALSGFKFGDCFPDWVATQQQSIVNLTVDIFGIRSLLHDYYFFFFGFHSGGNQIMSTHHLP